MKNKKIQINHDIRHVCVPAEFSPFEGVTRNSPGVHSYSANISRSVASLSSRSEKWKWNDYDVNVISYENNMMIMLKKKTEFG